LATDSGHARFSKHGIGHFSGDGIDQGDKLIHKKEGRDLYVAS
jgi:hypothetical protein